MYVTVFVNCVEAMAVFALLLYLELMCMLISTVVVAKTWHSLGCHCWHHFGFMWDTSSVLSYIICRIRHRCQLPPVVCLFAGFKDASSLLTGITTDTQFLLSMSVPVTHLSGYIDGMQRVWTRYMIVCLCLGRKNWTWEWIDGYFNALFDSYY